MTDGCVCVCARQIIHHQSQEKLSRGYSDIPIKCGVAHKS